ncbi:MULTISPECIES: hypothetical protein [Haloarcula]|nr:MULTISPECIES: hypothetical protein [Haloarculaceae]
MTLENIPSVEELAETTGQSTEQLLKDREAASEMACGSTDE